MKIFITGSASHLAKVLLPALFADDAVSKVTGLDLNHSGFRHAKFSEIKADVRDEHLQQHLHEHDILIHLAFVVLRSRLKQLRHDRQLVYDINVNGSKNVFQQAQTAGIKKIIHLSSASVYGAWPDNPELISEQQKRRAMLNFAYAEDKNAVEDWLEIFRQQSGLDIFILRPHVILGKYCQPFLRTLLKQNFYPRFPQPEPLTQCVWEDDVVQAIRLCLDCNEGGNFNLAAQPAMSFHQMLQHLHRVTIPVPFKLLRRIQHRLWTYTSIAEEPGWIDGMQYNLAVDASKAQQQLGWQPTKSTLDCISETISN